jgi:hypothetical protein
LGARRVKVTGEWRKLHNEELNHLYISPNVIRPHIKNNEMGGACGTYKAEVKCTQFWCGNLRERAHLEDYGIKGVKLKWIFKKYDGKSVDWIDLAQDRERWWPVVNMVMNLPVPYVSLRCIGFRRQTDCCWSYSVCLQMAPPPRRMQRHGAQWCHPPTTFQAASRRAPTCRVQFAINCRHARSAFLLIHGHTGRRVNENGLGPMTLGEFNQRYQWWAIPRRDCILIELRTDILAWVQEELSQTWN